MRFVADVHLHSRFARATSKALNPENLHRWAALKGLTVVGTGDYTHPEWLQELKEKLDPAETGLFRLGRPLQSAVDAELPPSCRGEVRFLLSTEISLIYKKHDKTRKVHHVVIMPDFEAVERLNTRLGKIGNLKSDGRPILGLDSRDLVEICLDACEDVLFIPAHIWTPHFAVLGSNSGFDSLEECFEDMLPHIFAVETGLSSDPPMNWRLSALDEYAIVSNSDAHSPQKLAREATCFDTELSYFGIYEALKDRDRNRFTGTIEFYPEEGKYHWDGHRKCGIRWPPEETMAGHGLCPVCGGKLTVGVLHRVEALADRAVGHRPDVAGTYENLIPLPEIIGSALGVGPSSKKVQGLYTRLLAELGPELDILRDLSVEKISSSGEPLVAEGVRRLREGEVEIRAGYDGVYGEIRVFSDEEREQLKGQNFLFDVASLQVASPLQTVESKARGASGGVRTIEGEAEAMRSAGRDALPAAPNALDIEQRAAVRAEDGPIVVVAGPGTGKTRVLTHRVAHLVRNRGVTPDAIVAVTFTNRAAGEMRRRLTDLLGGVERGGDVAVGTFHGLALGLLERYAPGPRLSVLDEFESRQILSDVLSREKCSIPIKEAGAAISFAKSTALHPAELDGEEIRAVYQSYQARLAVFGARDYDDILMDLVTLLETNADIRGALRRRCAHLLVDEFQDVNAVQYRLVKLMAGGGEGLFVIGDPDQAIYGFRGARPECFNVLFTDFPSARRFALKKTYRSTRHIIDAARALVARGGDSDALLSVRGGGPRPRLLTVSGETAEGIAVVREISRMVGGADMLQSDDVASRNGGDNPGHRSFADFAVLFRIWQQAEPLERCFLEEGLPYRIVGQKDFLEAGSVREALTFFRYVFSPGETFRLLSAAGLAPFDPGPDVLSELRRRLSRGDSMEALRTVSDRVERLFQFVARYRLLAKEAGPAALLRRWQEDVDCEETPDYERFVRLAEGVGSLRGLLEGFLTGREADLERSGGTPRQEAVSLMTLHAAKGLEFPVVFICGVEEGLIPHGSNPVDLEEERRLFYVGLTRAKDEVVLTRALTRRHYGKRFAPKLSRFVREISSDLRMEERKGATPAAEGRQLSLWTGVEA